MTYVALKCLAYLQPESRQSSKLRKNAQNCNPHLSIGLAKDASSDEQNHSAGGPSRLGLIKRGHLCLNGIKAHGYVVKALMPRKEFNSVASQKDACATSSVKSYSLDTDPTYTLDIGGVSYVGSVAQFDIREGQSAAHTALPIVELPNYSALAYLDNATRTQSSADANELGRGAMFKLLCNHIVVNSCSPCWKNDLRCTKDPFAWSLQTLHGVLTVATRYVEVTTRCGTTRYVTHRPLVTPMSAHVLRYCFVCEQPIH